MKLVRYLAALTLAGTLSACSDVLDIENPNNPDRGRVLRNPSDVENLGGSQFQQIISATLGNIARVQTGMMTAGFENASSLANNGLGPRSGIPRQPIDNNRGKSFDCRHWGPIRLAEVLGYVSPARRVAG